MKRPRVQTLKPRIATLDPRVAKPLPKIDNPHYKTQEHRAWALAVNRRAGFRCEHVEGGYRCECSTARGDRMYADHRQALHDRPDLALDLSNGQLLCASHHVAKSIAERARRYR